MDKKTYSSKNDSRTSNISNSSFSNKQEKEKLNGGVFVYTEPVSISKLAEKLGLNASEIIKFLFLQKKMVTLNTILEDDQIGEICLNFGYDFQKQKIQDATHFEEIDIVDDESKLKERPPIVTIMGHVDHGKTTLLDAIRKTKVAEGEIGGITQAIGAYTVEIKGKKITFLDTPGHAAFTAMRARGSQITDIVIIVVAADDGVMPQTREAVDHAKAANVPIIVAINKIDKPGADIEKIKSALSDLGLMPEEWGGDTIYVPVSAKLGTNLTELLENILLVSEVKELKANPDRFAIGTVVEAELDKGLGPVATLLIQNGTLYSGDNIVVGPYFGKVRMMRDDTGKIIKEAGPSTPVVISGISEVPEAGDKFMAFKDEKEARAISDARMARKIDKDRKKTASNVTLNDIYDQIKQGELANINVIIKADVQGSAEAVKQSLEKLSVDGVKISVIRYQSGAITEGDVLLAEASKAIIYGFNIRPDAYIRKLAEEKDVDIRLHNIIYALTEEMEKAMKGMLKPEIVEKVSGQLEVRQIYKVSKVGTVAGCYVTTGFMKASSKIRLIRDGVVIYTGELGSLKRFQSDAKEVKEGYECGATIANYNDIYVGDIIEGFYEEEVARKD